jgi:hypothetical protein
MAGIGGATYWKCSDCEQLKGKNSFSKKGEPCKICVQNEKEILWKGGFLDPKQICRVCEIEKDLFIDYTRTHNGIMNTMCKKCYSDYSKRKSNYKRKMKCNDRFEFNGKRFCKECKEIKDIEKFGKITKPCRQCLGMPENKRRYKARISTVKTSSELFNAQRERRVDIKKSKQKKFIKRFAKAKINWRKEIV